MLVNEDDVMNIMGGMEHAGGIKLNDHKRKLKNRFEICRKLGQGTYGKVQLGVNKETGQQVAIKTIKKSKIETEADLIRIKREIQIMSSVQHPNIIHIYEVFENKEKMVLVMEIAAGGELYDYLSERKCLEENEARRIFRQIVCAVYYCHKNNICHRDLKLENILLDENGNAKIADFGLSNVYDGKNLLETYCGSPLYASPEIVRGSPYAGPEVDCWSLGVLLYTLVYGAMPFDGSNFKRLVKQITTGDYYEPRNPSSASGLVRTMLTVSNEKRANIGDICSHWWVNEGYPQPCLEEAEYLASLTPVRLDVLLSLAPSSKEESTLDEDPTVPATPSLPPEEAMSIVELPSVQPAPEEVKPLKEEKQKPESKEKGKRKLSETPSMVDPDLVSKKSTKKSTTPKPTTPVPMEINENAVYERQPSPHSRSGRSTPKVRRKRGDGAKTPVTQTEEIPLVPEMTPEVQRKPPKPKQKPEDEPEPPVKQQIKRRLSRKDRNVKTPDPSLVEDDHVRHIPAERPMTPRQARAPSPEERPLVVPLPPPRVQDIPLPPVRGESLERPTPPTLPPRPAQPQIPEAVQEASPPPPPPRPLSHPTAEPALSVKLPAETPKLPIEVPKLPVEVPRLPVEVSKLPVDMPVPAEVPLPPTRLSMEIPAEVPLPPTRLSMEVPVSAKLPTEAPRPATQPSEVSVSTKSPKEVQAPTLIPTEAPAVIPVAAQLPAEPPAPKPKRPTKEELEKIKKIQEEVRFFKQIESTITPDKVNVVTLSQPEHEAKPLDLSLPALAQAKEGVRNSGHFTNTIQVTKAVTNVQPAVKTEAVVAKPTLETTSLSRQEQARDMSEDNKKSVLKNDQMMRETAMGKVIDSSSATVQEGQGQKVKIGPLPIVQDSEQQRENKPSENMSQGKAADNQTTCLSSTEQAETDENHDISKQVDQDPSRSLINSLPKPFKVNNIPVENVDQEIPVAREEVKEVVKNRLENAQVQPNQTLVHSSQPQVQPRQPQVQPSESKIQSRQPQVQPSQQHSQSQVQPQVQLSQPSQPLVQPRVPQAQTSQTEATPSQPSPKEIKSAVEQVVDIKPEPNRELQKTPSPIKSNSITPPQSDSPQTVPNYSLLQRPEKRDNRDSKVIKAAQYWNNYIGEVMDKKKPIPDNVKSLEKPKKIVSAGVGPKGYNDLKSAFEAKHGSPKTVQPTPEEVVSNNSINNVPQGIQRRNSRKLPIEGCNPGLKVLDAKSAFEQKTQPQTPVIYRRNSAVSGEKLGTGKDNSEAFLTSSGPNYIKKKVPEFPPPPISKTPFGANRRAGALSPSTVQPDEKPAQNGVNKETTTLQDNKVIIEPAKTEHKPLMNGEVNSVSNGNLSLNKPVAKNQENVENQELPKKNNNQESSKNSQELPTKNKIQEPTKELHKSKPSEEGKVLTIKLSISNNDENTKPAENVKTPEKTPSKVSHITPKAPQKVKTPETPKKIMMEKPIEKPEAPPKKIMIEKSDKAEVKPKESKVIPIVQEKPTKEVLKSAKEEKEVKEVKIVKEQPTEVKRVEPKEPIVNTPEKVVPIKREKKPADLSLEIPERPAKKIPIETQFSEKEPEVQESKSAPHRIIPIQIGESSSSRSTTVTSPTPTQSSDNQEMHIPIQIERKASRLDSTEEAAESRDGFSTNSLSRRRFGSRKKRSSFAYSDSSTGTNDEETQAAYNAASNLAGLQKFTSIGKPGTEPMFRLRKTKPPFAAMRSESFSSGEEDDFDDDGFREMTAENLFSTLLTRVKSLTRKIHDDDQHDQLRFPHQNPRMMNHRLNPGNTHAALERTALRSSLKRNNNPLSRQSSMDAYYEGLDDGASSVRSYGSSGLGDTRSSMQRGIKDQETDSLYSIGSLKTNENKQGKNEQQIMKRLGSSKDSEAPEHVSVTSKQRLRPGYLPPPSHLEPNDVVDNSTCRIENALSESGSMRNVGQAVQSLTARKVPITMERVLSNASLASGPSQSELLETISEKEPKRISRVIESVTSPTPRDNQPLPWASSQEPKKSPYKFVQMKRLSVGLDLDDDNRSLASTSSGYFSSQQQNPTQLEARRTKEGSRTSIQAMRHHNPTSTSSRKGTAMDHYRKISSEMQMAEADILSRLRREAAERAHDLEELSNGYTSPIDPDFFSDDTPSERMRKKSSGYMSRLEEDDPYLRSGAGSRHVTRRSISRELHDYTSPYSSNPMDFSRSSRERSLGRDLEPIMDVERRLSNRRSESLSRPSLASQGRSLTQSELGSGNGSSSSAVRRLSSGLRSPLTLPDDDYMSRNSSASSKYSSLLDDRNRTDWRRVSVPERGKDFKSLSKKYNRYSSVMEDTSDLKGTTKDYLATTSSSSKINPQYLLLKTYSRSNSQNRIPTDYATLRHRNRHSSLGHDLTSSGTSLSNYATLSRHQRQRPYSSATSTPMMLSPSETRQFSPVSNSREGSVTPRQFSHSSLDSAGAGNAATD